MFKFITIAALLLISSTMSYGQTDANEVIRKVEARYADAVKKQDVAALGNILADDFVATSSRGEVRNKTQEIADIKASPDFTVDGFDLEDLNVRVFNDTAIVTGRSTLKVTFKGQSSTSQFRYTRVYLKRKPGWLAVAQQLTRLAQ